MAEPAPRPRVRLRLLAAADAAPTAALISPGISRWTATWPEQVSAGEVAQRIDRTLENEAAGLCLARVIERAEDGALMGWVTAFRSAPGARVAALGYWIGEAFHGRGTTSAACAAFLPMVWRGLDIDVLEAVAQPANTASIAILRRLGMEYVGDREEFAPVRGRADRCVWYRMARPQHAELPDSPARP